MKDRKRYTQFALSCYNLHKCTCRPMHALLEWMKMKLSQVLKNVIVWNRPTGYNIYFHIHTLTVCCEIFCWETNNWDFHFLTAFREKHEYLIKIWSCPEVPEPGIRKRPQNIVVSRSRGSKTWSKFVLSRSQGLKTVVNNWLLRSQGFQTLVKTLLSQS